MSELVEAAKKALLAEWSEPDVRYDIVWIEPDELDRAAHAALTAAGVSEMLAELDAYHKFHEAISPKVGMLRAGYGSAADHLSAIHLAFRTLHEERTVIALDSHGAADSGGG